MGSYKRMPFPWTSKSKIKDLDYCPFNYYDTRVLKNREEYRDDAIEGTNMHMVFHKFFETIEPKHVFASKDFTDSTIRLERHPFRRFVYDACMQFVKPTQRSYGKYKNILSNFASIECERWLRINTFLHNRTEIFKAFKPYKVEVRLEYPEAHLFGTIDRINIEIMPDGSKKLGIYDYKTGNVPAQVRNHTQTLNMFDWVLPTHYMKEIHFYGLLYLLNAGWKLHPKIISFLEEEGWWYIKENGLTYKQTTKAKGKYLTALKKDYKLTKDGRILQPDDIILGYYFLNGDKGYRPIKKYTYTSHKNVLNSINNIRSVIYNKYYVKHPVYQFNNITCEKKKCSKYDKCEKLVKESKKKKAE